MKYYIYQHIDPITNKPFYIGKGTGKRAYNRESRSSAWKIFVSGLEEKGLTYSVSIVTICETEVEAFEKEEKMIQELISSGQVLFNKQVGKTEKSLIIDDLNFRLHESNYLSSFIRHKRKSAKLTQVEFAKKCGLGLRFIRELEKGKKTLRMDCVNQALWMFGHTLKPARSN